MEPCTHDHLIRNSRTPEWYSCQSCGSMFTIKPLDEGDTSQPEFGVPDGQR